MSFIIKVTFRDQVYSVKLAGEEDSLFLRDLERQMELDFWSALPRSGGGELQVMVSPGVAPVFELALRNRKSACWVHMRRFGFAAQVPIN